MLRSVLILAFQASVYGPPSPAPANTPTRDDAAADRCPRQVSDEIVVCKHAPVSPNSPRYGPSSRDPDPWGRRFRVGVGRGSLDGHSFVNQMGSTADGITLTVPF